jgi:hypothetical protein
MTKLRLELCIRFHKQDQEPKYLCNTTFLWYKLRKLNPNLKRPNEFNKMHTIYFTVTKIQRKLGQFLTA